MKGLLLFVIMLAPQFVYSMTPKFLTSADGGVSQFHLASPTGALPTYRGNTFGGSASYSLQFQNGFAFGPYISVSKGSFENTANSEEFAERVSTENLGYGLLVGVHYAFFSAGLLKTRFKNTVSSGSKIAKLESETIGGQVAAGLNLELFSQLTLGISLFSNFGSFGPTVGGFSQNTHFVEYGARANLVIPLPSGSR